MNFPSPPGLAAHIIELSQDPLIELGLNATLTLALSFTLVRALKGGRPNNLNYPHYWRRSLL